MKYVNSENGFTLIEILIALTIFAIGLLSIAGMQVTAIKGNMKANVLSTETALAEGVLEEILVRNPDNAIFDASTIAAVEWDFDDSDVAVTPITLQGSGTYTATYQIELDYGVNNVARVEVTVQGADPANQGHQVTVVGFKRMV